MKKVFTLFAAVALMASVVSAQGSAMRRSGGKAVLSAANGQVASKVDPMGVSRAAVKGAKSLTYPIWNATMSYCLDEAFVSSVGTGSIEGDTVSWAIRIPAEALAGRNNLTDVEFFVASEGAGTYHVSVVSGAQPTGTAQFSQNVTVTMADTMAWKTVHFTTPLAINANADLWVIVSNSDVSFPAAGVAGTGYDDGQWIFASDDDWFVLSAETSLDYTWMIRAISDTYTVLPPVVDVEGPTTALVSVAATFRAVSLNTDSYAWTVDGNDANTTTATLTYTFTTEGLHEVVVAATNTAATVYDTINVNVIDCSNAISTFPFTENFESELGCWSFVSADPANDNRCGIKPFDDPYEGDNVFVFSSYATASDYNQFLISPELDLSGSQGIALFFRYLGYRSTDSFRILASTTTNDTAAFTTVLEDYPTVPTLNWTLGAVVLPANTKYIAFNYYGDYQYYLYLDAINFDEFGTPSVTVDGPDTVGTGISATYVASAVLADSVTWEVDGDEITYANGDTLSYIFTTAGNHIVVALAHNVNGTSSDTLEVSVYSCDDIQFPYFPEFNRDLGCWQTRSDLTEGTGWFTTASVMSNPVGQVVSISAQSSFFGGMTDIPADNWLFSPVFTMPATGRYEVAWDVMPFSPDYAGDHYGLYIISGTDTTLLFEETLSSSMTDFVSRAVALPATTGDFTIAFRHFDSRRGYAIILDAIQVRALTAPAVALQGPENVEINTEATFTATCGNADSYAWTVDGVSVNTNGNVMTTSFTTAGNHTVAVTATNTEGSDQASIDVNVFTCEAIAEFPYTQDFEDVSTLQCWRFIDADGDGYNWDPNYLRDNVDMYGDPSPAAHNNSNGMAGSASWDGDPLTPDNWMVMPALSLPAGQNLILSWYEKGQDPDYAAEHYSVYVSTTGREISDFTTAAGNYTATGYWVGRNIDLSQYAGQTIYVAFRHHNSTDMYVLDIDDIRVSTDRVAIDEVANSSVALYPNPATTVVTLEGLENGAQVNIVDINGRTMRSFTAQGSTMTLNVADMAKGAYFVRVSSAATTSVSKLIVK